MSEPIEIKKSWFERQPGWLRHLLCALWEVIRGELDAHFDRV